MDCEMAKLKLCRKSSFGYCVAKDDELKECPFYNMYRQFITHESEDKNHVEKINQALERNKELYGEKYCPCSLEKNKDTICPCLHFREMESGTCHCGKFVKTEEFFEDFED